MQFSPMSQFQRTRITPFIPYSFCNERFITDRRAHIFFCMDVTVRSLGTELQGHSSAGLMMLMLRVALCGPAISRDHRLLTVPWRMKEFKKPTIRFLFHSIASELYGLIFVLLQQVLCRLRRLDARPSLTEEWELSDGDRIRFEFEVQNSVSVTQFLPKDPTTEDWR